MAFFDKFVRSRFGKARSHERCVNVGLQESQRPCRKCGSHSEFAQIKGAGICAQEKMGLAYLCERLLSGFKVCLVVGLNCGVHLDLIRLVFDLCDLDLLELVSRSRLDSVLRVSRTPKIRKPATCIYLRVITVPSASRVFSRPDTHAPPRAE